MHKHFHVPEAYFLSHSVGCLPKTSQHFVTENIFKPWQVQGGNAWPGWLDILAEFRTEIGALLGVTQADICPQTNVSSALTKILYSLPKRQGRNTIVLSKQDFPTIGFVLKQAERAGYVLRFIEGDITDPEVWAEALDESVHIVHITHVVSNTSHLLPVEDICTLARASGAYSIVDIAQSVGAVPIHAPDWKPDFVIGTSVKFICGGPGACFLYVAPERIGECQPIDVGWFSHENPFEMNIDNFRYAPDAMRFLGGSPSPTPFATALSALKLWQNIGTPYVKIQALLSDLSSVVPEAALVSSHDKDKRGGTLVVAPREREPLRIALATHNILHDERAEGFRFSVHGYTQSSDIEALKHVLSNINA